MGNKRTGTTKSSQGPVGAKRFLTLCGVILVTAGFAGAGVLSAPSASAEALVPVPETGSSGLLSLSSSVYPLKFPALSPGDTFNFQIGVALSSKTSGKAYLQIAATGNLAQAGGYSLQIQECPSAWQGSSGLNAELVCASGVKNVISAQPITAVDQAIKLPLSDLRPGPSQFLRVSLLRPLTAVVLPADSSLQLGIGVIGFGDDPPPARKPPLASTGSTLEPFLWAGGALLAVGAGVLVAHKRKDPTS